MGNRLEKANEIIQTSKTYSYAEGKLIVHSLLSGRIQNEDQSQNDLSVEELVALAKGYNWWGKHDEAFHAINTAIEKQPNNEDLLVKAVVYIQNAHNDSNSLLETYENYIQRQIGPVWFWRIQKAQEYEFVATYNTELEDYVWEAGYDIVHPQALEQAIDELMEAVKAVKADSQAIEKIAEYVNEMVALRQSPRFDTVMEMIKTP